MKIKLLMPLVALTMVGCASDFYYENGKKIELSKVKEKRENSNDISYYKNAEGRKLGVKNEILLQCVVAKGCKEVLAKYELDSVSALSDKIFLVKVSEDKNVFEMSQKLYEDEAIEIAHPNFIKTKKRR